MPDLFASQTAAVSDKCPAVDEGTSLDGHAEHMLEHVGKVENS